MDQQATENKADVSPGGNFCGNSSSAEQRVGAIGYHSRKQIQKKQVGNGISEEELKIRGELENDIERDLEEEIKDGIYHLALRLHRLYQHQKERNVRQVLESAGQHDHDHQKRITKKSKTLSEVNINIRMEGGTKIEIKETKKEIEDPDKGRPWTSSRSENMQMQPIVQVVSNKKKFDWANSLRSGADPGAINKTSIGVSHPNFNIENGRKNLIGASGQRKGSAAGVDNKVLELGWKC